MFAGGKVHTLKALKALPDSWLPGDASGDFARLLARYMTQAAIIGDDYGQVQLGTRVLPGGGVLGAEVKTFIESYVGQFSDEWVQAQSDAISAAVQAGLEAGSSMDTIAGLVGGIFNGQMSDSKATMIARTETIRASNEGAVARYANAGVAKKEWSADGEGTCAACDDMDGQQVGVDEEFTGDDGSMNAPPAHPDCRCSVLPVLAEFGAAGGG